MFNKRGPKVRSRRSGHTKTGCLQCKIRKKKCDERKPECRACERNGLLCSKFPLRKSTGELENTRFNTMKGPGKTEYEEVEHLADVKYFVHDNLADRTVRRARSQTSREQKPSFLDDELTGSRSPRQLLYRALLTDPSSILVTLQICHPFLRNESSGFLLQHFVCRSAETLSSVRGESNPFIKLLLPIAMTSDLVLHSILALSGIHYRNLSPSHELDIQTWTHLAHMITKLKHEITQFVKAGKKGTVVPLLVATLVLCVIETVRGDLTGTIYLHLKAVGELLKIAMAQENKSLDSNIRGFAIEYYTYSATLSDVILDDEFNTDPSKTTTDPIISELPLSTYDGFGALCGCAHSLFPLIPQLSSLTRRLWTERRERGNISSATVSNLLLMESRIREWRPPKSATDSVFARCGRIYQQAMIIYLIQSTKTDAQEFYRDNQTTGLPFERFIGLLQDMPLEGPISQTLCWPLAVAGCCMVEPLHRKIVHQRLIDMYEAIGIRNYVETAEWLTEIWNAHDAQSEPANIYELLRNRRLQHSFA